MEIKNKVNNKISLVLLTTFIAIVLFSAFSVLSMTVKADTWSESSQPDVNEMTVYVNGELSWYGYCYFDSVGSIWNCQTNQYDVPAIERGSNVQVKISFVANEDLSKAKVYAWINGYKDEIESKTSEFDVFAGSTYTKTLNLDIPKDLEEGSYALNIKIEQNQELSGIDEAELTTKIQRTSNLLEILSIESYSENGLIEAGSTLYNEIVVKNRGNYKAEDIYTRVRIPELGIERTAYLGDLDSKDNNGEDAKKIILALSIPSTVKEGTYTIEVTAYNSEISYAKLNNVFIKGTSETESEESETKTIKITPQVASNDIEKGKGAVYTILVSNFGTVKKDFTVSCDLEWADTTINPQTFSLEPGKSKLVNIYLAVPENAVDGEHTFSVNISYGNESQESSLTANVITKVRFNLKTTLIIIGIVLGVAIIVLLVLLLTSKKQTKKEIVEEGYYWEKSEKAENLRAKFKG